MFSGDVMGARASGLAVPCSRRGPSGSRACTGRARAGRGSPLVSAVSVGSAVPGAGWAPARGMAPLLDGQWGCSAEVGGHGDGRPQGVEEALDSAGHRCFGNSPPTPECDCDSFSLAKQDPLQKAPRILVLSTRAGDFRVHRIPVAGGFGSRFWLPVVTAPPGEGQGCTPICTSPGWGDCRSGQHGCTGVWYIVIPEVTSLVQGEDTA